jgi:putative membrane protein
MEPGYWWGPMFGFGWIFPLLCFVFMIAMMFMVLRRAGRACMPMMHGPSAPRGDARETPRQILDTRLASGEIDRQEYENIRRSIESQ